MLIEPTRRRDVFKRRYKFRSAVTGQYVSRWFAFKHPRETIKERVN